MSLEVAVAFDGIGNLFRRIEREVTVLAEHGSQPTHLPHHPLHRLRASAQILWQEAAGLFGEINQDRAGFEYRKRSAAI